MNKGGSQMKIIEYETQYQDAILEISLEWLNKYDILEEVDIEMLKYPERILEKDGHIFLAQEEDGEISGMVMLENHGESCEVLKFGVREIYQGRGIGRKLMREAIHAAKAEGKKKLTLCSNHQLSSALHLYQEIGFCYVDRVSSCFVMSDVFMEMDLGLK